MDPSEPTADPGRTECSFAGLRYTAEPCPDATRSDIYKSAALGGGLGWFASMLLGATPMGRLISVAAGAAVATYASRHHVYLDWDPDRLRYGSGESDGPPPDSPPSNGPSNGPSDEPLPPSPTSQGVF